MHPLSVRQHTMNTGIVWISEVHATSKKKLYRHPCECNLNVMLSCVEKKKTALIHTDAVDINAISPSDVSVSVTFEKPPEGSTHQIALVSKKSLRRYSRLGGGWCAVEPPIQRRSNQVSKALIRSDSPGCTGFKKKKKNGVAYIIAGIH